MSGSRFKIHKFGGSSLADAECIARVGRIVGAMPDARIGVVVSAMGGMTDQLLGLCPLAEVRCNLLSLRRVIHRHFRGQANADQHR